MQKSRFPLSFALAVSACLCPILAVVSGCDTPQSGPKGSGPFGLGPTAAPGSTEHLASMMVGSYSSTAQAVADPEFRDIHLTMVRIWSARKDGPWIYVEQAAASSLDKPYRQRVYQLVDTGDPEGPPKSVESRVFELPGDPLAFAGAWTEPKQFDALAPNDLLSRDGCTVFLSALEDGTYQGSTHDNDCPSTLRGAAYATSVVTITPTEVHSWDRGFNKGGEQVWGAVKGPYEFVRLEANKKAAGASASAQRPPEQPRRGTDPSSPPRRPSADLAPPMGR